MERVQKTMEVVNEASHNIDDKYDLRVYHIEDIYKESNDPFELICNAFKFGYMQGMKATKAEMKRGANHA